MPDRYTNTQGEVRWRARWRTGSGERHSRSGFRTEGQARAHEEAMRTARRRGRPVRPPKAQVSVAQYWRRWWAQEVVVAKARGTQFGYRAIYSAYIAPALGQIKLRELIEDPQILVRWRTRIAQTKSQAVVVQAQRVLSSMLSAAAEEGVLSHNPVLLLEAQGRRGRARKLARSTTSRGPAAIDPVAWFLVVEYLRQPTRPGGRGAQPRVRRYPLDRARDALIVALGFMAGLRLPSEALGLTYEDVRHGRLHIEGRSSQGEYVAGSKTGPGRDLPLVPELADELKRVRRASRDAGRALHSGDFWIAARDGGIWSENQAHAWREREFRPVARQIARDFPQFSVLAKATPYLSRHTFVSCCLQAGISLATIASWCGTSIQMISRTYGRMIRRHEGAAAVELAQQYRTAKVEAMSLLSARSGRSQLHAGGGSRGRFFDPAADQGGSTSGSKAVRLPRAKREKESDLQHKRRRSSVGRALHS